MSSIITNKGLALMAQLQAAGKTLTIDKIIFANIPGLDPTKDPDPNQVKPSQDKIVYEAAPTKTGYVNPNCVVYSSMLGPDIGDFDFTWVGLYCSEYSTLIVVSYNDITHKKKTSQFDIGNTIYKNIGTQYTNITDLTAITIKAETWQLDFSARFGGIDERERCSNFDMYGNKFFEGNGFQIVNKGGYYTAQAGLGYVRGIQISNPLEKNIGSVGTLPTFVYIDAWLEGNYQGCAAQWQITVSSTVLKDYKDSANQQHYVELIATIAASSAVTDNRNDDTTGNSRNIPFKQVGSSLIRSVQQKLFESVSILDYGCDNTGKIDCTAQLQSVVYSGARVVKVPQGTYLCSDTINVPANTTLIGEGVKSIIQMRGNKSIITLGKSSENIEDSFNIQILNLKLFGGANQPLNNGIEIVGKNSAYISIDRVNIYGFGGSGIIGGVSGHINNIEIKGCEIVGEPNMSGDGINMMYGIKGGQTNAIWIHHNNIISCKNGVKFFGNNVIIESNTLQNNANSAIQIGESTIDPNQTQALTCVSSSITNNYCELTKKFIDIYVGYLPPDPDPTGRFVRMLNVSDNFFPTDFITPIAFMNITDLKKSSRDSSICLFKMTNNYAGQAQLLQYNTDACISEYSEISSNNFNFFPTNISNHLPPNTILGGKSTYVYNQSLWSNYVNIYNQSGSSKSFYVTLYCNDTSIAGDFSNAEMFGKLVCNVKVSGIYEYGDQDKFVAEQTYYGATRTGTDVVVTKDHNCTNPPLVSKVWWEENYKSPVGTRNAIRLKITPTPAVTGSWLVYFNVTNSIIPLRTYQLIVEELPTTEPKEYVAVIKGNILRTYTTKEEAIEILTEKIIYDTDKVIHDIAWGDTDNCPQGAFKSIEEAKSFIKTLSSKSMEELIKFL